MIEIRHPPARGIRPVEPRARADLREHRRVQRVGRHRHEHFAAGVDHRRQGELDAFGGAGGEEHAIGAHGEAARRVLGRHRLARRRQTRRRAVAVVAVAHRAFDGLDEVERGVEAEGDGVADVQIADTLPGRLDPLRLGNDVSDGVREAVDALSDRNRRVEHPDHCHGRILPRDCA